MHKQDQPTVDTISTISNQTSLASGVATLAAVICHNQFPSGDLAALRRMKPASPPPPAFWRLLFDHVPPELRSPKFEQPWAVVLQGMAIMVPVAHNPGRPLGRVLREINSGSIESRLIKLLGSHGPGQEDQVRLLSRMLAAKKQSVDWSQLAELVFATSDKKRDQVARCIAREFFRKTT